MFAERAVQLKVETNAVMAAFERLNLRLKSKPRLIEFRLPPFELKATKKAAHWTALLIHNLVDQAASASSPSLIDGPESLPLASTSRSTNSITAMAALSPKRKPAFMMR